MSFSTCFRGFSLFSHHTHRQAKSSDMSRHPRQHRDPSFQSMPFPEFVILPGPPWIEDQALWIALKFLYSLMNLICSPQIVWDRSRWPAIAMMFRWHHLSIYGLSPVFDHIYSPALSWDDCGERPAKDPSEHHRHFCKKNVSCVFVILFKWWES